ncbi:PIG-L deacetylase family protein [Streptomyces sp. NPDC002596]
MADTLEPMPDDWSRALAVVAHPDDMEFGSSGAVAAWTASGKSVAYVLVTHGEAGIDNMSPAESAKVRADEQLASARIVGAAPVEFLDHPDGSVEHGLPLRRDIAAAIRRHRPELVITCNHHDRAIGGGWNMADHRNTGRAVLDAVGDAGNRWIFPDLGLEPWAGVRYVAIASSPVPTHAADVGGHLDSAVASVEAHAAYLAALGPRFADVRGPLTGYLTATGARAGLESAVPFELLVR